MKLKLILYMLMAAALVMAVEAGCSGDKNVDEEEYGVYENHDISACGIEDPLNNLPWLHEYVMNNPKRADERIFVYRNIRDDIDYIVIERGNSFVLENMPLTYISVIGKVPPQPYLVVYSCLGEQIFDIRENSEFWYEFAEANKQIGILRTVKIQTKNN